MIRQLIREMLLKETLEDVAGERGPMPSGIEWDSAGGGGLTYAQSRVTSNYRRDMKKLWDKHADHGFFQDPSRLFIWHVLGMYSGDDRLSSYFPHGSGGKIPGIHFPNKNELSCFGALTKSLGSGNVGPEQNMSYFTFKKYRVTFASKLDVESERLSKATAADIEKYRSSGLPKRPGVYAKHEDVPLSEDDINPRRGLDEVVIDNWVVDTYYCHEDDIETASAIGLKCRALGT